MTSVSVLLALVLPFLRKKDKKCISNVKSGVRQTIKETAKQRNITDIKRALNGCTHETVFLTFRKLKENIVIVLQVVHEIEYVTVVGQVVNCSKHMDQQLKTLTAEAIGSPQDDAYLHVGWMQIAAECVRGDQNTIIGKVGRY